VDVEVQAEKPDASCNQQALFPVMTAMLHKDLE